MQPFLPFSSPQLCQLYFTTLFAENYPPRSSHAKANSPLPFPFLSSSIFISFTPRHGPSSIKFLHFFYPQFFFFFFHASGSSLSRFPPGHCVLLLQLQSPPSHPTEQLSITATFSPFQKFYKIFTASPLVYMQPFLPFSSPPNFVKSLLRHSLLKITLRVQVTPKQIRLSLSNVMSFLSSSI
jgi:hypothetical protein